MGYQALYRRYRPARFEDFVGQEAVIKTLRSQVMSGRIAHAYLFCGTRGTGKTSTAKVFARAVNCEHPENGDPCGQCAACQALSAESSLDILEIDAASNNGVDEIRDLREKVKYPPQNGRYRVYIIDEVHMLSTGAFNALLKTLEEPPSYVVFILATTEPQKLPATILSRCQRFDFHRIPMHQIIGRMKVAVEKEGILAEEAALSRIARAAEGGMRDAWSIMDMCLGYAQEDDTGLTEELVLRVLGAADRTFLFDFADKLIGSDAVGALTMIDDMMRMGREVQVFVRDVSAHRAFIRSAGAAHVAHAADAHSRPVPRQRNGHEVGCAAALCPGDGGAARLRTGGEHADGSTHRPRGRTGAQAARGRGHGRAGGQGGKARGGCLRGGCCAVERACARRGNAQGPCAGGRAHLAGGGQETQDQAADFRYAAFWPPRHQRQRPVYRGLQQGKRRGVCEDAQHGG